MRLWMSGIVFLLVACSRPSEEQLLKIVTEKPEILANAIQKNPAVFQDALRAAMNQARQDQMASRRAKAAEAQENSFKEPLKPELGSAQVFRGAARAPITIVEYTDLECPSCARGAEILKEVLKQYPDKVRVTVKHLPLPFHKQAMPAAKFYEAIRLQKPEAALLFHDRVLENRSSLVAQGEAFLEKQAKELGVDTARLRRDLPKTEEKIQKDMAEARSFGFRGTPSFVVGGIPVQGAVPAQEFARIIDRLLKK